MGSSSAVWDLIGAGRPEWIVAYTDDSRPVVARFWTLIGLIVLHMAESDEALDIWTTGSTLAKCG